MDVSPEVTTLVLADPNALFRYGMVRLLESQPDMQVVGETDDCLEAVQLATRLQPNVILLEMELNGCDGPTLVGLVRQEFPAIHLVFLTTTTDPDQLLSCVLAGASGYLQKNITPDELFARLRGLRVGEAAISLTSVLTLMQRLHSSNYAFYLQTAPHPNLTPRESEILALVARGMTNKKIGAMLCISEHTVRNHLCGIYQKLNLKNRLQVAVYGVTHGLIDIDSVV
jgi:two-component system nitrate/nitrite response regulator NarL